MTTTDTAEATPRPKPVRRPPAGRPAAADGSGELLAEIRAMRAEIEELKKGGTRFIESEAAPKPTMREASPESISPFTRKLLARTHAMPEGGLIPREPSYNVPLRWYYRPDGDYVQLQGDAKNRAMYEDLGFTLLSPEEEAEYLKNERPGILNDQHERATLINGLRRLAHENKELSGYDDNMGWYTELEDKSIPELEAEWHKMCRQTSTPKRDLPKARQPRRDQEPLLVGVERAGSAAAVEDLQRKLSAPAAQTRTIEVTRDNADKFRFA